MEEIWKPLKGIVQNGDNYEVSSLGNIRNVRKGNILKLGYFRTGYVSVSLNQDSKAKKYSVHRLVALAFIPNPENKPQVNHKNGVKDDNRLVNLEWMTQSENQIHAYAQGLQLVARGSKVTGSKLTAEQVVDIKRKMASNVADRSIAEGLNVSIGTIRDIRCGKTWVHIEVDGFYPIVKDCRGEANFNTTLTDDKVKELRYLHNVGNHTVRQLATIFGISSASVSRIVNYKTWKHVE